MRSLSTAIFSGLSNSQVVFWFPNLEISFFLDLDLDLWCFVLLQNGKKGGPSLKFQWFFFYLKQVEVVCLAFSGCWPRRCLWAWERTRMLMDVVHSEVADIVWKLIGVWYHAACPILAKQQGWVDLGILEGSLLLLCDLPSSPVIVLSSNLACKEFLQVKLNMVIMRDISRKASVTIQNFRPPFHTSFNFPFAFHEIRSTTLSVPASQSIRHRWSNETFSSWVIPADTMNSMSLAFFLVFFQCWFPRHFNRWVQDQRKCSRNQNQCPLLHNTQSTKKGSRMITRNTVTCGKCA